MVYLMAKLFLLKNSFDTWRHGDPASRNELPKTLPNRRTKNSVNNNNVIFIGILIIKLYSFVFEKNW